MNLGQLQRVHCLGLGGVGVSAVARLLQRRGVKVSGSDVTTSLFTDDAAKAGIIVMPSELATNITPDIQLVIYSDACPPPHVERVAAKQLNIPEVNFAEVLGWLMAEAKQSIAVAGTNGKSTTTALLGLLLAAGQHDPTVVVGSRVPGFDGNVRFGAKEFFVTEADEYRDHFLAFHPTTTLITNIEHDHADYFPTLAALTASFRKLAQQTDPSGHLIINLDDPVCARELIHDPRVVTFSQTQTADFQVTDVRTVPGAQELKVSWQGKPLGPWSLHLPGSFNVMNAAAAAAAALTLGGDPAVIGQAISNFQGIWRRFEVLNPGAPITIISDYAHHPTSLHGTIAGAKQFYPGRRLIVVFQPHHHHRLSSLFHFFTRAFAGADEVIISEVYDVVGREDHDPDQKTSRDLVAAIHHGATSYAASPAEAEQQVWALAKPGDVVMIIGAGDIWTIGPSLVQHYA